MYDLKVLKSMQALIHHGTTAVFSLGLGIYFIVTYIHQAYALTLFGYILTMIGFCVAVFLIFLIKMPKVRIELNGDILLIYQSKKKTKSLLLSDIQAIKGLETFKKYTRPFSKDFFKYGTLIIKLEKRNVFVLNIEDVKKNAEKLNQHIFHKQ